MIVTSSRRALCTAKLEALEIARGHDGLLRGRPEPTLLLGLGHVTSAGPKLLARNVVRFGTISAVPTTALPRETVRLTGDHHGDPAAFFLLAIALEEDGGGDVAAIYGALEAPARWAVCPRGAHLLEPLDVGEGARTLGPHPVLVEPMIDGTHYAFDSDDLVGAVYLGMKSDEARRGLVRLHFVSEGGENDWTARLMVSVRAAR